MSAHSTLDIVQLPGVYVHEVRKCTRVGLNTVYSVA